MGLPEDVRDLKQGQRKLQDTMLELTAGQARTEGAINTLGARMEAHLATNAEAMKALFASRREQGAKIEDIRVDYVPRDAFDAHRQQNRKDHTQMAGDIGTMQWKVAKIAGGVTLLGFLVVLAVRAMGVWAQ